MPADPPSPVRPAEAVRIPAGRACHVRVILTCPCGGAVDLTYLEDAAPASDPCHECGTELEVPGDG